MGFGKKHIHIYIFAVEEKDSKVDSKEKKCYNGFNRKLAAVLVKSQLEA